MKLINIVDEDFINYKKASMFIITCKCSFKCDKEYGTTICQNSELAKSQSKDFDDDYIVDRYMKNDLTEAIVFGGLEPLDQFDELISLIDKFRKATKDDIVIYTGYNEDEIRPQINKLCTYKNIIVKFGRFIPNSEHKIDKVLGVELASSNQYARVLKMSDKKNLKIRQRPIKDESDKILIEKINEGLAKNRQLYGKAYCPCRIQRKDENVCMCKEFKDQTEPGFCHCGKFEKYYEE